MFSALDYVIVLLYLLGTIWLGLWVGARIKTGSDFFLAGRSLPWWAVGMSLVATDIGGTDIIGVGGAAFKHGLAVANFEWIGCIPAMIVCAFVFAPHFWRTGICTIPEFLERRYHVSLRVLLAVCWLVFMACNLGIMLFASAKMMKASLGVDFTDISMLGWSLAGHEILICSVVLAVLTAAYTISGGLAAVVYTDVVQCTVMVVGCFAVLALGLYEVGGVEKLRERVAQREAAMEAAAPAESHRTDLILPVETKTPFAWPAIYFGLAMVLSPAYWIGNQAIIQRAFGAKSAYEAKAAYISGALLKCIIPLIIAVPGLIAFALYPDVTDGDQSFPILVARLLPSGMRGLFMAAFLAALMSTFESYLNSAATILCNDLIGRFIPAARHHGLRIGRWTTVGVTIWGIAFSIACAHLEAGVYDMFQTLMSFFQGPVLAMLLAGVFWRRATAAGAFGGFVAGLLTSLVLFLMNTESVYRAFHWQPLFQTEQPYLYYSTWSFVVSCVVLSLVSLMTKPQPMEQIELLLYRRARKAQT